MPPPDQLASWAVAFIFAGAAAFERRRSFFIARKHEENAEAISDARKHAERAEAMSNLAEEYKTLFEREHKDLAAYREEVHANAKKAQETLLRKEERIVELQARPDFTELFAHLKSQAEQSMQEHTKIINTLEKMMHVLLKVVDKNHDTHQSR